MEPDEEAEAMAYHSCYIILCHLRPDVNLDSVLLPSYHSKQMVRATISSKGQVVIPKAVRDRLNLKAGTQVTIDVQGEALVMKRSVSDLPDWQSMRGMFKGGPDLLKDLRDERAAELARDDARVNQHR